MIISAFNNKINYKKNSVQIRLQYLYLLQEVINSNMRSIKKYYQGDRELLNTSL